MSTMKSYNTKSNDKLPQIFDFEGSQVRVITDQRRTLVRGERCC